MASGQDWRPQDEGLGRDNDPWLEKMRLFEPEEDLI